MCNKAVDNYAPGLEFVSDQYKTQEMCIRAVNTCSFVFNFVLD